MVLLILSSQFTFTIRSMCIAENQSSFLSRSRISRSSTTSSAGVGGGAFDPLGPYTREQAVLTALRLFRWAAVMSPGA